MLFAVGVRAGREGWLDRLPPRALRRATLTGLAALPALPLVLLSTDAPRFETGFSAAAVVYAFWEPLVALGAIAMMIGWGQRRGNRAQAAWAWAAANSYGAFLLHAPVLVAVSRGLDSLGSPHALAMPVAVAATATVAFGATALLRQSGTVRRVI